MKKFTSGTKKRFKKIHVDADSLLFAVAVITQELYILCTHKETKEVLEFSGVQKFYGRKKAKNEGWIGAQNIGKTPEDPGYVTVEDFDIEHCRRLPSYVPPKYSDVEFDEEGKPKLIAESQGFHDDAHAVEVALKQFDIKIGELKQYMDSDQYILYIGGKGNYRTKYARMKEYKGTRAPKPALFNAVRDAIIAKYKNRLVICDGEEAEDTVGIAMFSAWKNRDADGTMHEAFACIDKDVFMVVGDYLNYKKYKEGFISRTPFERALLFCAQCLSGDSVDNIPGLPNLTRKQYDRFDARYSSIGIGPTGAKNHLKSAKDIPELFQRVVDAYKDWYGEGGHTFTSWDGKEMNYIWLDFLKENAILLYMRKVEGELYNIENNLKSLGVDY